MHKITRIVIFCCGLTLLSVLFVPIWRIELGAPQYPEGLVLSIHATGLRGNVDIINGLNHYIGMKRLHNEDFIEFTLLPYIITLFALAFVLTALLNRRKLLYILLCSFIVFGIVAMVDFWRWEYDYGHNLEPNAAIVVPGMAYQPPLIGFKQLLNFGAYSIPDIGGWLFIAVGALCLLAAVWEWNKVRKSTVSSTQVKVVTGLVMLMLMGSCNVQPSPITPGKDNCFFCKMTITDAKFGAELLTKKGKAYKFDDLHCLLAFYKNNTIPQSQVKEILVADFNSHELLLVKDAVLLKSDMIRGPMNGEILAVKKGTDAELLIKKFDATRVNWQDISK